MSDNVSVETQWDATRDTHLVRVQVRQMIAQVMEIPSEQIHANLNSTGEFAENLARRISQDLAHHVHAEIRDGIHRELLERPASNYRAAKREPTFEYKERPLPRPGKSFNGPLEKLNREVNDFTREGRVALA